MTHYELFQQTRNDHVLVQSDSPGQPPMQNSSHRQVHHHHQTPHHQPPQAPFNQSIEFGVISDLHFPLHFSRVEKPPSSASETTTTDQSTLTATPPPLDFNSVGGGGRDFLTPLLHPTHVASDMNHRHPSQTTSMNSAACAEPAEFGAPVNLTVGDELPIPFAPVMPLTVHPAQDIHSRQTADPPPHLTHPVSQGGPPPKPDALTSMELSYNNAPVSAGPSTESLRQVYPDLNEHAIELFNYFRDKQSILMSVSPLNYFRSVFLAFSLRYRAILYGVLAWAAWHQGNQEEVARKFFDKASLLVRSETINSRSKEEILAALLILASAKISSGDTTDWRPYLVLAGETIHLHGGLTSFMESESVRWLLKNFAYHEVLASSSLNMPKLFSANDFEIIFNQPSSASLPDTLCACCQNIFVVLERINELTRSVRLLLNTDGKVVTDRSQKTGNPAVSSEPSDEEIESIYITAHNLEERIWALQPAHKILRHLSDQDLRLQLALFDVFKLVAVLHMYQSVLRINSASLSMRVAAHRLRRSMDELFGTTVEGILTFPLFVLGISSTTKSTRQYIIDRFNAMVDRLSARNATQARQLVEKVWALDDFGQKHVDWNELVDQEGLHFCFA